MSSLEGRQVNNKYNLILHLPHNHHHSRKFYHCEKKVANWYSRSHEATICSFSWHFKMMAIKIRRLKYKIGHPWWFALWWGLNIESEASRSKHLVAWTQGEGVVNETLGPAFPVKSKPSVTLQPFKAHRLLLIFSTFSTTTLGAKSSYLDYGRCLAPNHNNGLKKHFRIEYSFEQFMSVRKGSYVEKKNGQTGLMSRAQNCSWITKCSWGSKKGDDPEDLSKLLLLLLLLLLFSLWGILMLKYHSLIFSFLSQQCVTMVAKKHWLCSWFAGQCHRHQCYVHQYCAGISFYIIRKHGNKRFILTTLTKLKCGEFQKF